MSWYQRAKTFLAEVRSEMKKVTFPSREDVIATSIVVIITSIIFAVFLWVADYAIFKALTAIQGVFG